jgi:hypothetical protein
LTIHTGHGVSSGLILFTNPVIQILILLSASGRDINQAAMFVLKGLGRIIWGDPDKTDIVQINSGQLYLIRPKNSVKGTSECMYQHHTPFPNRALKLTFFLRFKDAAASIRRTTTQYNYQLVIQRAYEEGEEQFSEDEDGNGQDGK